VSYSPRRGSLLGFIRGSPSLSVEVNGAPALEVLREADGSLSAHTVAGLTVPRNMLLVYLAMLAPYVEPAAFRFAGQGRIGGRYRYLSLALAVAALASLFASQLPGLSGNQILVLFGLFVGFSIVVLVVRLLGRKAYHLALSPGGFGV
jgi:hypothetical protein